MKTMTQQTTIQELRRAFAVAMDARDAIESCCSLEWLAAHKLAKEASAAIKAELNRLLLVDRYGAWRDANDKMLQRLGYYDGTVR
jgi:hypothetical protein